MNWLNSLVSKKILQEHKAQALCNHGNQGKEGDCDQRGRIVSCDSV